MVIRDERGTLQVPMILVILILGATILGTWGFLHHWKNLARLQLRLDRCAGEAALELRDTLNSLDSSNREIDYLRAAISTAGSLNPYARATLQTLLSAEVIRQEITLNKWRVRQAVWITKRGCGGSRDLARPLPSLTLVRDPPDATGPQRLRWAEGKPESFRISVSHSPRHGAAKIKGGSQNAFEFEKWTAQWANFP